MLADIVSILTAPRNPSAKYRVCPRCVRVRPLSDFGIKETYLQSYCRECNRIYQKEWYKKAKASGKR